MILSESFDAAMARADQSFVSSGLEEVSIVEQHSPSCPPPCSHCQELDQWHQ